MMVDKIISDGMDTMNLDTLRNAAELSSMKISPRTLGPDKPEWRSEIIETPTNVNEEKQLPKLNKTTIKTTKSKVKTNNVRAVTPPMVFQNNFPDIDALNSSIIKSKVREECKRSANLQLNKLEQRQLAINEQIVQLQNEQTANHQKRLLEKQHAMEIILQRAEQEAKDVLQQQQQQLEQLRDQTKKKLQQITFQGIAKYQTKFRSKYESIAKLLLSLDKDAQQACSEHNQKLREQVQLFEQMIGKIKEYNFGPEEYKTAVKLCASLEALENCIIKELSQYAHQLQQQELDKANAAAAAAQEAKNKAAAVAAAAQAAAQQQQEEANQRQKELEEKLKQEQQLQQQQQQQLQQQQQQQQQQQYQQNQIAFNGNGMETLNLTMPQQTTIVQHNNNSMTINEASESSPSNLSINMNAINAITTATHFVDPKRLLFYNQINELYHAKVERVKPLQNDENWRKYRANCQKAINVPLNTIASVSGQHLLDKFEKLYNFIIGHPVTTPDGQISVNDHPLARDYCILLMAKKFVGQAESATSSNPKAAFPIASVIVQLWKLVPDFGLTLLAYIFKESPFLVPYFIPPMPGLTKEDYLKTIGYRMVNNQLEAPDFFLKRQAGLARLYGAIMISNGRQADTNPHPYGMAEAWRWMTHFVSLMPLPDICATLLLEMLQTIGSEMWRVYGIQFTKLLMYIENYYFPHLNAIDCGGPKTRLELLLSKYIRDGQIPQATGLLPPGFW